MYFCSTFVLTLLVAIRSSTSVRLRRTSDVSQEFDSGPINSSVIYSRGGARSDLWCLGKYILEAEDLPELGEVTQPIYVNIEYNVTESRFELTMLYKELTRWAARTEAQCMGRFEFTYPMIEPPVWDALKDAQSVFLRSFVRQMFWIYPSSALNTMEISYLTGVNTVRIYLIESLDDISQEEQSKRVEAAEIFESIEAPLSSASIDDLIVFEGEDLA